MLIKEVVSSTIKTVAYDKDEQKLWLRFKSDALYEYSGVEQQVVTNFLNAESQGKFFHEHIRNKYTYAKIEE